MSDPSDVFQYFANESPDTKNADLYSFGPPPQPPDAPSPELFDQDVDQDVAELDLNWSFDDFLSTVCDNVPAASTLPALTYSTDSGYEIASSLDFYINAPSILLIPPEIVTCGSVNDGSHTTHDSIYSPAAELSDGPLLFPPTDPVTALSDYGTSYVSTSIPVHVPESEVVQVKAQSDYGGSVNDGLYTTYDSIYSPVFVLSDGPGLLPFPPANLVAAQSDYETPYVSTSTHVHMPDSEVMQVKAQSDYGTSGVSTPIPVHVPDYEAAQVKAQDDYGTPGVSTSPLVHVHDSEAAQTAKDKPFKCTECPFSMLERMRIPKWLILLVSLCA